jgi:branched-chain amino acid transport system ATP-binding protein
VSVRFGGIAALRDIDLTVAEREVVGIIGPNGAGKTTLFNVITGVAQPNTGTIELAGQSIVGLSQHVVTERGVARTFQNIRLFDEMTVRENVLLGADCGRPDGSLAALLCTPAARRNEARVEEQADKMLAFCGLSSRAGMHARNLSYGDQRRLEIARALATRPKLLLVDEPAAGFNPTEKKALAELILSARQLGCAILLIEHDIGLVSSICDRVVVLNFGEKIAEGTPSEVKANPRVVEAYLGTTHAA